MALPRHLYGAGRPRGIFRGRSLPLSIALGILLAAAARAQTLDTVIFGDTASESSHGLTANQTEVITGQLGLPARRCLPFAPTAVNGGDITVTMAVDPVRRNYFTVKLWGGDDTAEEGGRLYLYVPINGTNYQIGYRHEGDYTPLSVSAWNQPLPGRFFYSTTLLPLWMTKGKTSLSFKIISTGKLYSLGSGGPPSGTYQFVMDRASRGIYRAYTHVNPYVDFSGETQGSAPAATVRPSPGAEMMSANGTFFTGVNNRINNRLTTAYSTTSTTNNTTTTTVNFTTGDVAFLARSYSISGNSTTNLAGYNNPAVITKVVSLIDAFATDYYANPSASVSGGGNEGWGGRFGNLGQAMSFIQGNLTSSVLDATVTYGNTTTTRRAAWGDMLYASREYGRISSRRTLTNQTTIASQSIYTANKGLLVLGDSRAFSEEVAQRYLKEACGLLPWLGSDAATNRTGLPSDGTSNLYGTGYYQVTPKGLTREWGYVGAGYGEMAYHVAEWYRLTGNDEFRQQMVKMALARAPFRRPAIEVSGSAYYPKMEVISLLAWRGANESDGNYAGYVGYADTANTNEGGKGLRVAALGGNATLLGYAKQMLADNQFFTYLDDSSGYYNTLEALESFADYQTVKNAADSGSRLPMTDGQPDFAWSDEGNRIVALKQGGNRLWITPYWQAKAGTGINSVARFHFSTPTYDQYGVLETTPRFRSNFTFTRPNYIDMPEQTKFTPPDNPRNAYAGEVLPVGEVPAGASDDDPFRGKADFYAFRFGRYLFGLNAHPTGNYTLMTPTSGNATEMTTNSPVTLTGNLTVGPLSTVVLDLGTATDSAPLPGTPLVLTAVGSSVPWINLNWTDTPGATSYTVSRSDTKGGPYTALEEATGITETTFTDTSVTAGSTYYYVVSAANANGTSYDSMEASTSAGVPPPWADADVGAVGTAGSCSASDGAFTITGYGTDIGGTTDSFHFVYVPMSGNCSITARLASLYDQTSASKVGLMMRQSMDAGSPYVFARVIGASLKVAYRTSSNGNTSLGADNTTAIPEWYRLTRNGNTFTISYSGDGSTWTAAAAVPTVAMTDPVYVGLAACSRNTGIACQATFDGLVVPGKWEPLPPVPSGLSALAGVQSAGLTWTASTGATGYSVKRATVSGGPYTLVGTTGNATYSDGGLSNEMTYYYVVSATNSAGESGDSSEVSVTPTVAPPEAPAGLDAQAGNGFVTLAWSASYGATGYNVKRSTSSSGTYATLAGGPTSGTTFTDTTVANGTTFYYIVTALGVGGESAASSVVTAKPSAVPSMPSSLSAMVGNGQVALSWAPALGAANYTVYRSTSANGTYTAIASGITSTSYTDTGLTNGSTYYYRVSGVNSYGESVASGTSSGAPSTSVLPPPWTHADIGSPALAGGASYNSSTFTVVGGGTGIGNSSDQFQFVFQRGNGTCDIIARVTSLTNTNTLAKAGLMIRPSLAGNSPFVMVDTTPSTANGARFEYRSAASGNTTLVANSTGSQRNSATPPEWLRLTYNGTAISAYRSNNTSTPTTWTQIGTTLTNATLNTALAGGYYIGLAVTSSNSTVNTSAPFTKLSLSTGTPPPPTNLTATAGNGNATLTWTASTDNSTTSYTVKRATTSNGSYSTVKSGVTSTTYTDAGLASGTAYYYVVSATNPSGEGANSTQVAATTPTLPSGLSTSTNGGQITLAWNAFPEATSYIIKRATSPGGTYTQIAAGITGTGYTDTGATGPQSYYYVISALKSGYWQTYDSAVAYASRGLPSPWITQDIGNCTLPGNATYSNGVLSLSASGSDIGSNSDNFRIACIPLTGNGTIIARITGQDNLPGSKTGFIMRESLTGNSSKTVIAVRQADAKARFAVRTSDGGSMNYTAYLTNNATEPANVTLPYWLKLERSGNSTFTASISPDGSTWTVYGSTSSTTMPNTIYAGFCGVSRNQTVSLSSSFDNISVTGWTPSPYSPGNLTATGGNNTVSLSWSAAYGATGYNLRRSSASGGPYSLITGNLTSTSYTDTNCVNGATYYYVLSSLGAAGESTDSAEVAGAAMTVQQAWRLANFGTTENSGNAADAVDPDGDGWTNAYELASGTDPNDPSSLLHVKSINANGNALVISFPTVAGKTYRVEFSDSLQGNSWSTLQASIAGTGGTVEISDPVGALQPKRFYRIVVQ